MSDKQENCKITLSQDDRLMLDVFLLMTTKYRKQEMNTWEKLSNEKNEDGTPVYKNAKGNAKWWSELCDAIPRISRALNNYEYIKEETTTTEVEQKSEPDICE